MTNAEVALGAARNLRRPDLSAVASLGVGGLDERWTSAHSELGGIDDQHRWTVGLVFSVPLGNRSADGQHERARLALVGEKRLISGLSTAFEVLRLQTDLAVAQNAETAAVVGYRTNVVRLQFATGSIFGR